FGFSVPIRASATVEEAIGQIASSGREIGIVPVKSEGRWWDALKGDSAPKIFAKLPFIEVANRPAALPAYVIGPPLRDVSVADVRLFSVAPDAALEGALMAHGGSLVG